MSSSEEKEETQDTVEEFEDASSADPALTKPELEVKVETEQTAAKVEISGQGASNSPSGEKLHQVCNSYSDMYLATMSLLNCYLIYI